jgi:hypothetical protein
LPFSASRLTKKIGKNKPNVSKCQTIKPRQIVIRLNGKTRQLPVVTVVLPEYRRFQPKKVGFLACGRRNQG